MKLPLEGIIGLTGSNGSGKTNLAVKWALELRARGFPVWSTFDLGSPVTSWKDVLDVRRGVLVLDEVHALMGSREWSTLPHDVATAFQQWRKRDTVLLWTSPSPESVDVTLRRVTGVIYRLDPLIVASVNGRLWPRTILSVVRSDDGQGKKRLRGFHRIRTNLPYDSSAEVLSWTTDRCTCCGKPLNPGPKYCACAPKGLDKRAKGPKDLPTARWGDSWDLSWLDPLEPTPLPGDHAAGHPRRALGSADADLPS